MRDEYDDLLELVTDDLMLGEVQYVRNYPEVGLIRGALNWQMIRSTRIQMVAHGRALSCRGRR